MLCVTILQFLLSIFQSNVLEQSSGELKPHFCAGTRCLSILWPAEVNENIPVAFLPFELGFDCT